MRNLVIGVTSTHVETLIISSAKDKAHKLTMRSNFVLRNSIPPLLKASFVKLDSYQKTDLSSLVDLTLASGGMTIDHGEFSKILQLYRNYYKT